MENNYDNYAFKLWIVMHASYLPLGELTSSSTKKKFKYHFLPVDGIRV